MALGRTDMFDTAVTTAGARAHASMPRAHLVALAAAVILAALCVIPRLGSQSLWTDEAFTILPSLEASTWSELPARVRAHDTHPPLSHAVLFLLRDVLPRSEVGWRLPSFVFVELGLLFLYATVARAWNHRVALSAFVLGQIAPYLLFYAMEARGYALWFLTIMAAFYCMTRWAESLRAGAPPRAPWMWALGWAVANAAGLWTHLFHVFAMAWQAFVVLVLVMRFGDRKISIRAAATAISAWSLASIAFLPWLRELASHPLAAGVGWTRSPSLLALAYHPFGLVFGSSLGPDLRTLHGDSIGPIVLTYAFTLAAVAVAMLVIAVAVTAVVRRTWPHPKRRWETVTLVIAPAVTLLGPLAYVVATSFPLTPRHLLFAWPAIPVLLALAAIERRDLRLPIGAVAGLMLYSSANLLWNPVYAKDDERSAARFADAHSRKPAHLFGDLAPLYARGSANLVGHFKRESRSTKFEATPNDVWLVETRAWQARSDRERLDDRLAALGLRYEGAVSRFHGVVLHHWRYDGDAPAAAPEASSR